MKYEAPALMYHDDASKSKMQVFLSTFMLNTLAESVFKTMAKDFKFTIDQSMIPASVPVPMDTTTIDHFFPGLAKHFGDHKPVKVELDLIRVGSFDSRKSDQHLSVQLDTAVKFLVVQADNSTEEAINVNLMNMMANVSVSATEDMKPVVKILAASVGYITETRSAVGHVNCTDLAKNINAVMSYGVEVFTAWFATKADAFVIPTNILGLFELSDLTVKYHDGFIEAGLTPTFIPQPKMLMALPAPVLNRPAWATSIQTLDEDGQYSVEDIGSKSSFLQ